MIERHLEVIGKARIRGIEHSGDEQFPNFKGIYGLLLSDIEAEDIQGRFLLIRHKNPGGEEDDEPEYGESFEDEDGVKTL